MQLDIYGEPPFVKNVSAYKSRVIAQVTVGVTWVCTSSLTADHHLADDKEHYLQALSSIPKCLLWQCQFGIFLVG